MKLSRMTGASTYDWVEGRHAADRHLLKTEVSAVKVVLTSLLFVFVGKGHLEPDYLALCVCLASEKSQDGSHS